MRALATQTPKPQGPQTQRGLPGTLAVWAALLNARSLLRLVLTELPLLEELYVGGFPCPCPSGLKVATLWVSTKN